MLPSPLVTVELAFGYMLEHPCIPRYQLAKASGNNAMGADNQQERPRAIEESSETKRQTLTPAMR